MLGWLFEEAKILAGVGGFGDGLKGGESDEEDWSFSQVGFRVG